MIKAICNKDLLFKLKDIFNKSFYYSIKAFAILIVQYSIIIAILTKNGEGIQLSYYNIIRFLTDINNFIVILLFLVLIAVQFYFYNLEKKLEINNYLKKCINLFLILSLSLSTFNFNNIFSFLTFEYILLFSFSMFLILDIGYYIYDKISLLNQKEKLLKKLDDLEIDNLKENVDLNISEEYKIHAAYHEASHTVIALLLGLEVSSVDIKIENIENICYDKYYSMYSYTGGKTSFVCDSDDIIKNMIICPSGYYAEKELSIKNNLSGITYENCSINDFNQLNSLFLGLKIYNLEDKNKNLKIVKHIKEFLGDSDVEYFYTKNVLLKERIKEVSEKMVLENWNMIDAVAKELLLKEYLNKKQIDNLLNKM